MQNNVIRVQENVTHGDKQLLPYIAPHITVYGEVTELTKSLGVVPPSDSEHTVSGKISP